MSEYKFNPEKTKKECIKWIRDWFDKNGHESKAIVGVSGGKDSSVVASLCVAALGKGRVVGVLMPNLSQYQENEYINAFNKMFCGKQSVMDKAVEYIENVDKLTSSMSALSDGYKLCEQLEINYFVVNISSAYNALSKAIGNAMQIKNLSNQTKINMAPRLRMTTLYGIAQSMNGRVANTSNLSEIYLGYGTRWGDTVGDFAPLANLTCTEVKKICATLPLPKKLINRVPDDGLCGLTDEESFGFTYAELDSYIRGEKVDYDRDSLLVKLIDAMHESSEFKRLPIASYPNKGE